MKSRKRASFLAGLHRDQSDRIRTGRDVPTFVSRLEGDQALLAEAEQRVRSRIRLRRTLPLNLLFLLPGLFFIGTRSRVVLALFIATYPALFLLRALVARFVSALIGPEEILVRQEYERLRGQRQNS